MEAERVPFQPDHEKEPALEQLSTKPAYRLFVDVDIVYRTFTAACLVLGAKPKLEPKAYAQTTQDFERFEKRLHEHGSEPAAILVVMEATGS
jgi:hypothetical protein